MECRRAGGKKWRGKRRNREIGWREIGRGRNGERREELACSIDIQYLIRRNKCEGDKAGWECTVCIGFPVHFLQSFLTVLLSRLPDASPTLW